MSEKRRVLPRDYSAEQMDRGVGMIFHPTNGKKLCKLLRYSEQGGYYVEELKKAPFVFEEGGAFGVSGPPVSALPRISGGQPHVAGDPYPEHWEFCPFTREKLE